MKEEYPYSHNIRIYPSIRLTKPFNIIVEEKAAPTKNVPNRAEKKLRKAMLKLNMRPISGKKELMYLNLDYFEINQQKL